MSDQEESIRRAVLEIASDVLEVDSRDLTLNSHLVNDLGATSVSLLTLSVALERRFGVALNHEHFNEIERVNDVVALLTRESSGNAA